MRDKNFTVNFDRLPDFEVAPNVPATKWQEQMEHESESSLLGEMIRFAVRFYCASRWLAYFWSYRDELAEWYNDGQPKSGFVPSQDLIRTLTKGE